jgi:hypothetical protein
MILLKCREEQVKVENETAKMTNFEG